MTMVPAQTLSEHHQLHSGGYGGSYTKEECYETAAGLLGGSDPVVVSAAHNPMAEDESRTTILTNTTSASLNNNDNNEFAASSSKDAVAENDDSWLQLSIGGSAKTNTHAGVGLVELDLLPPSGSKDERVISRENTSVLSVATPIFHVPQPLPRPVPSFLFQTAAGSSSSTVVPPLPHPHHRQENIDWTFRPAVLSMGTNSLSSPTSCNQPSKFMQLGSYFSPTPFQFLGGAGGCGGGSSLDFRVIDPPRRPYSGIWFSLQASENQ